MLSKLFPKYSTNIVKDTLKEGPHDTDFNHTQEEVLQMFPDEKTNFRRNFSENFYRRTPKCKDVPRLRRPRLVKKCGELNITRENVLKHRRRLFSDIFNTILDIKWRWHFIFFLLAFIISWFLFANVWYMIAFLHGDFEPNKAMLAINSTETIERAKVCINEVHDFISALLFSIETQHTIGYGFRHITEECPPAIILLMLQSCFGVFLQGLLGGIIFAKIARPNKRKRTIIFSHNACVSERDGKLCFMFKLANVRISQLSDACIKIHMIKSRRTSEGEFIPFQSYNMKVAHDWSGNENIFFPWPKTIEHVIDESSPMYEMCKQPLVPDTSSHEDLNMFTPTDSLVLSDNVNYKSNQMNIDDYEIVVILEGNIENTGASCHIRTSYLPQEILFGYRFTPIYPKFNNFEYLFDYSKFDQVEPIQPALLGLNVAFINIQDNYVYDALNEVKNLYQTVQNTVQDNDKKMKNQETKDCNSIFSLLKRFGQQQSVDQKLHDVLNFPEINTQDINQSQIQKDDHYLENSGQNKTGRFNVEKIKTCIRKSSIRV